MSFFEKFFKPDVKKEEPKKERPRSPYREKTSEEEVLYREYAKKLFGERFFGPQEIKDALGFEIPNSEIPPISYNVEILKQAKENGERLILRVGHDNDSNLLTLKRIEELAQNMMSKCYLSGKYRGLGKYQRLFKEECREYLEDSFYATVSLKNEWRLVGTKFVPGSGKKDYIQQTRVLRDYLIKLGTLSEEEKEGCSDDVLNRLRNTLKSEPKNWKNVAEELVGLLVNQNHRRSVAEIVYDNLLLFTKETELTNHPKKDSSKTIGEDGMIVSVSKIGPLFTNQDYATPYNISRGGAEVDKIRPDQREWDTGVVAQR
jgi:hypothetical protein